MTRPRGAPFEDSLVADESGCLIWTGACTGTGYGNYKHPETKLNIPAHVYAWEKANGPTPVGHELHHRCRVKPCVNVDHLVALTPTEHKNEHAVEVTHCPQGHEYDEANTYIRNRGNGRRQCRACHREEMKNYRERLVESS
jgi:hypothetical protein